MLPIAVLIMAYGSPGSLNDIEPYLLNVRGGRPTPPPMIEAIRARYGAIGGRSPLLQITQSQASALDALLKEISPAQPFRVFVGMRHWHPYIQDAVQQIGEAGLAHVVALCLTPYTSTLSTQAYFDQLDRALASAGPRLSLARIPGWHLHPPFIHALAVKVQRALDEAPETTGPGGKVVFTAHSLPVTPSPGPDGYAEQVSATALAVAKELGLAASQWTLCYQSAGAARGEWLGPSLEATLDTLSQSGVKHVLVAPIGFVSDHIETLYDLDIAGAGHAKAKGLSFKRAEALNTEPAFIQALAQIVLEGGQA